MKPYKIQLTRIKGKPYKRIRFTKDYKCIFNLEWLPEDIEAEAKNIRSADLFVLKNNLKYLPRKLKKK